MMPRHTIVLASFPAAALFLASVARGASPESARAIVDLAWDAPAGCPSAADVEVAVARLVGAGSSAGARTRLRGRVSEEEDGQFRVTLDIREGEALSERVVVAP